MTETQALIDANARITNLERELGRAYRALQGYADAVSRAGMPTTPAMVYHAPTLGAAKRFVFEDALDGADYFEGKPVEVLYEALKR